jgi:hypothetical protein
VRYQVRYRILAAVTTLTAVLGVFVLAQAHLSGQAFWSKDTPKLPMAKSWLAEKAKLPPYTPSRTPDGVPDLQGRWGGAGGDGTSFLEDHEFVDVTTPAQESFVSDPPDGKVPYTPWALERRKEILAGLARGWPGESGQRLYSSPASYCFQNMPAFSFGGQEIVQQPGAVTMLAGTAFRVIPTDGRTPVNQSVKLWFGTSRGRWDGDTLVVEVTNLNGLGWLDSTGQYYTENTRMTERWRMVDANTIDYEVTVEDPTVYTRPWKMNFPKRRAGTGPRPIATSIPNAVAKAVASAPAVKDPYAIEPWEVACYEGNRQVPGELRRLGYKFFRGVTPPK